MPQAPLVEVVVLKEDDYQSLYQESFKKPTYTASFTEAMHRAEFDRLDQGLRQALAAKWEEDSRGRKDFAMMGRGEAFRGWHHCGAIYSSRICCPQYLEAILGVLAPLPQVSLWTYHTACEPYQEDSPLSDSGEFFIRGGRLYAPKDRNNYARVFAGQKPWWRFW